MPALEACLFCDRFGVETVDSRAATPWRRRRKRCRHCRKRWSTIEILDPADPLTLELARRRSPPDDPPPLISPDPGLLRWQEACTWLA